MAGVNPQQMPFRPSNPYWRPNPVAAPSQPAFQPMAQQLQQQLAALQAAKAAQSAAPVIDANTGSNYNTG
jgi:hypothetical protein